MITSFNPDTGSATLEWTPTTDDDVDLIVRVRDAAGGNETGALIVRVDPAPTALAIDLSVNPSLVAAGNSVEATISVRDGTPPYDIVVVDDRGDFAESLTIDEDGEITLSFVPGQLGAHSLTAEVDDANGARARDEAEFEVEVIEAVWLRIGFESNPNDIEQQVMSLVLSQQGSFTSCTASDGSIAIRVFTQQTDGTLLSNITFNLGV